MKTLKQQVVIMEDSDQLEVRSGDITVNIQNGGEGVSSVRVSRPPTDGRYLRLVWGALDKRGNRQTEEAEACGYVDLEAVGL